MAGKTLGPLHGMRVVDWTVWQQGPFAGAMLGDLGADVIKLEEREGGDFGRSLSTLAGTSLSSSAYFEANNRNKKSVALDLKRPEAKEIIHRLIKTCDIFITNFRPGVPDKLGLDYETLRAINPRLIYGNATAYGPKGPDSAARSTDLLGQARSGIMTATAPLGWNAPVMVAGAIADQVGAMMLAYGVVGAVVARERFGIGQKVDTSLLGSMLCLQGLQIAMQLSAGFAAVKHDRSRPGNPIFNIYRCADDRWLAVSMVQPDRYWEAFVRVIGRPELATDERFTNTQKRTENTEACTAILDEVFVTRTRDEWIRCLSTAGEFVFTAVNEIADLPNDPQVLANGYIVDFEDPERGTIKVPGVPVMMSETPLGVRFRAPELGEHTEDILTNLLGYSWDDIARFRALRVI